MPGRLRHHTRRCVSHSSSTRGQYFPGQETKRRGGERTNPEPRSPQIVELGSDSGLSGSRPYVLSLLAALYSFSPTSFALLSLPPSHSVCQFSQPGHLPFLLLGDPFLPAHLESAW